MDADTNQAHKDDPGWGLGDTVTVTEVRAAGGFLQKGEDATPSVYLEISGTPTADIDEPVIYGLTYRLVLDLDMCFKFMAAMEHAGKVALLMPTEFTD